MFDQDNTSLWCSINADDINTVLKRV